MKGKLIMKAGKIKMLIAVLCIVMCLAALFAVIASAGGEIVTDADMAAIKNAFTVAQYCSAFAFSFGRVRRCTLPSRKPHAPCLACIKTVLQTLFLRRNTSSNL